jgi:TetR/AcrR family transcriptional repressor of nem operon
MDVDRKSQILGVAAELVQERGVAGFSYADVAERIGIRKASIHHHFANKDVLVTSLASYFVAQFGERIAAAADGGDPWSLFEFITRESCHTAGMSALMCPGGAMLASQSELPPEAQRIMKDMMEMAVSKMAESFERGRTTGVMDFPGDAVAQAHLVMSALPGAVQTARLLGPQAHAGVVQQLRTLLKGNSPVTTS